MRRDQSNGAAVSANNSFLSSASSVLLGSTGVESLKSGFIVGFFGSPDWETRPEIVCTKPRSEQQRRMYHLQDKSHSSQRAGTARSKKSETHGTCSSSTLAKYAHGPDTSQSPKQWSPSRLSGSFPDARTTPRYFSLPALKSKDRIVLRRHASLVHPMNQQSQSIASADELGYSSLRLVERSSVTDIPLPLAPSRSYQTGHERLQYTPSLPALRDIETGNGAGAWFGSPKMQHNPDYFTPIKTTEPRLITPPKENNALTEDPLYAGLHNSIVFPTRPDATQPEEWDTALKQVDGPNISPPLPSSVNQHPGPMLPLRLHTQYRRPRPRRSPTLAPSPLRRMILPDSSESVLGYAPSVQLNKSPSVKSLPYYGGNGRPSPSTSRKTSGEHASPTLFHEDLSPSVRPCSQDDPDDPSVLLGMIRELVEETSAWDPDLFVDPNFKSMIEESRLSFAIPTAHGKSQASRDVSNSPGSSTRKRSEGSPTSSAGHQNNPFPVSPATSASHRHPRELMEFWDGKHWIEDIHAGGSVGLAW
ncbi:hypothetical protein BDN72DRAFT_852948 [Pluteus cervinus]|uniref:Uncharacterized protein n=1 Tax=Pluteus cervinus TaxID=181527 RepID=A0ACD3BFU0_9AGAR|nr:hypothetical protein BDN72DRAFT_852948 [Pluteus cervinus]